MPLQLNAFDSHWMIRAQVNVDCHRLGLTLWKIPPLLHSVRETCKSQTLRADGDTPLALMDHAQGEATVMVTQAAVQRISGLDSRLAFFLDILRTAHINADREDAISLSKGVVNANLHGGRLILDKFLLVGPLVHAWGAGEFTIKDKHLKLSGGVRTALGVTRKLNIDRILERGEGDGSVSF